LKNQTSCTRIVEDIFLRKVSAVSPELVEDLESNKSNIGEFEKAVAKAEQLSKAAREAAEKSTRASQEAVDRADRIGREAKEAAEASAKAAQEAVDRAEKINKEAREAAEAAIRTARKPSAGLRKQLERLRTQPKPRRKPSKRQ